jgi:cysteinyl-tRNA synthetase
MKIFNTLNGQKDEFKPLKGRKINLFVCGPTVYDYSHIGHARNYISFDCFVKYLRYKKYNVFYLQNITNIDDKIIARAREKSVTPKDLALAFEKEYIADMKKLGISSVSKYARATDYIKEIISQVKRLQEKGITYEISEDGIYYDISKFENYGKLAGRTALDAEDAISRIDYSKDKRNRGDFCLWKFKQQEAEPSWKAPFGEGRPGWHIEDTAITEKFFGAQYDIHGGARDLIFPHHEAEIAQMESISGKHPLVKYWMHVGFLTINGQKMSKSVGNFITISEFLRRYHAKYLRFFIVKNLWRSPIDYTESTMIEVCSAVNRIEDFLYKIKNLKPSAKVKTENKNLVKDFKTAFCNELDDDFNTPKAFAVLFDFINKANQMEFSKKSASDIYNFFQEINNIFSIIDFKKINQKIPVEIKKLAKEREQARKNKDWQTSDNLRKQIEDKGYIIEDTATDSLIKIK